MNEQAPSSTAPRFSNPDDVDEIVAYRRFNLFAWIALLVGLLAGVALLSPFLWSVPVLGIVLGICGLAMVRRNENMGGRGPSWIAITLCCFCLTWAISSFYFQRSVLYKEAEVIGKQWLQLVLDGEDMIAHQAMLHPARRQGGGFSVDQYYAMDEDSDAAKDRVFKIAPASEIMALGPDAEIRVLENQVQQKMPDLENAILLRQLYRISKEGGKSVEAILSITRQYRDDLGRANWIVADIEAPK